MEPVYPEPSVRIVNLFWCECCEQNLTMKEWLEHNTPAAQAVVQRYKRGSKRK